MIVLVKSILIRQKTDVLIIPLKTLLKVIPPGETAFNLISSISTNLNILTIFLYLISISNTWMLTWIWISEALKEIKCHFSLERGERWKERRERGRKKGREGGSKERRDEGKKQGKKAGGRMKAIFIRRVMRATNKLSYYLTLAFTITFEESILLNVPQNIK